MKTLTPAAQAIVAQAVGTETIQIVEIEWETNSYTRYSTKDGHNGIIGKILEIGTIQSVLTLDNRQSETVNITIDDTDGELKEMINSKDIQKVKCNIYQSYDGLAYSDKFLIFTGQISTPFTWGEGDRSIQFTVNSEIESYEVGFSPEEGQLDFVSTEFIGKPWPLGFGSPIHVPATKVHQNLTGELDQDIDIVDPTLQWKLDRLFDQWNQAHMMFQFFASLCDVASYISAPVSIILTQYVATIIAERQAISAIAAINSILEEEKLQWKKDLANERQHAINIENITQLLEIQAIGTAGVSGQKEFLENDINLAEYEYQFKQQCRLKQIEQYNIMLQIYGQIVDLQEEICRQSQIASTCFKVLNGETFVQATETEITINDVRFKGQFNGDIFCQSAPPVAKYLNLQVDPWVPDDAECIVDNETNGINMFILKDDPPKNLTNLWLLVRGADAENEGGPWRHILKVKRQVGRKVYYDLVSWGSSSDSPSHLSLDSVIKEAADLPIVPTSPFGGIPPDLFTGNLDPKLWGRPEAERLAAIIASIPGGVNPHELKALSKLVFLEPLDELSSALIVRPTPRDIYTIIGQDVYEVVEASGVIHEHWLTNYSTFFQEIPNSLLWHAEAGATVREQTDDCDIYIANILPSTIHSVYAYRKMPISGSRRLVQVPSSYYVKKEAANLGTIDVTALVFPQALKSIAGEDWEDDIYVTYTSSVGPNVCDIIQHLIETYVKDGAVNAANFAAVKAKFLDIDDNELYPCHFALFDRPNVLDEVARIAWEARCAIYKRNNEYFIKYLSEEPTTDATFTLDDIETQTLSVTLSATEEIVTRMNVTYSRDYLPIETFKKQPTLVYRHNVKKYGLHTRDEYWHIYNIPELVEKSATFWLIRLANTWKQIDFRTFMTRIALESYDTVLFNVGNTYWSTGNVKGVLRDAVYDPKDNSLQYSLWLPVRSGEMIKYKFAWPALEAEDEKFPTDAEITKGLGGGYGPGSGVTGTIDGCAS